LLRSLFMTLIYVSFLWQGMAAPFILTLGYVWVDTFRPQSVAWFILNQLPVALIMGVAALGGYFAMDRRSPPRLTLATLLTLLLGGWVTASMFWAEVPLAGWAKWDWAFKTVMFSAFIPLVIRSRVQIEAFAQVYVFTLAANFIPFGAKVLISGGGYGRNLGLIGGNGGLAEGGQLAIAVLMTIPLSLYLSRHRQLLPRTPLVTYGYVGLAGAALLTALGTYERSALVGMAALGTYMFMRSRRKMLFAPCLAVVAVAILYFMSSTWTGRVGTITNPTADLSAMTRLLVWTWTVKYAFMHPLGGGFNCFIVDRLQFPDGHVLFGHAFESSYFEMLGEQGWVGFSLFVAVLVGTLIRMRRLARRTRQIPHLAWCADMSDAVQAGLVVFMTAGAFLDVAFQPELWYFIALSVSLSEYVRRVEQHTAPAVGWRARAMPAVTGTAASAAAGAPWRRRPAWSRPGL
jgi:putative inorganic carbon (hco3(-)) transporter